MTAAADAADATRLVFTTLPWDGCESFATPRPYFERLSRDAARLDIAWPQDFAEQLRRSLKETLKQKPRGSGSSWPSPPGLLRVELTREGVVNTALRALPVAPEGPWKAISCPAPWFGRYTGTKHGAWGAYRNATAEARSKDAEVALLFDGDTLVDGDRCAVLLRTASSASSASDAAAFLMPNEAETVPSIACRALGGLGLRRVSGITRQQLLGAEEVLVVGSGVGLRRLSHLDGHPLKCSDDSGYRRCLAAMEASRENRWCSFEETVAAAAQTLPLAENCPRSWDVGADDQMMPFLAEQLRRLHLWGECDGPWSPDQLLLHSGGPVTDVASSSLLAGPPLLRFVVQQPQEVQKPTPSRSSSRPLQGQLPLLRSEERLPLTWQPQQFAFGRWQALPELPAQQKLGPALRQVATCARQILTDSLWSSEAAAKEGSLPVRGSSLAGLLSYDLVQWTQPLALEHPPEPAALLGALYRVDRWLIHQRSTGKLHLLAPPGDPWAVQVAECMDSLLQDFQLPRSPNEPTLPQACYTSSIDDEAHIDAVKQVQDAIRNGQFYQLNFGRSWRGELRESPWQLMQKLFKHNAAPYSGFLQLQVDGLRSALCSCSPELLLSAKGGKLCTCPIKGTCARSLDAMEDQHLRQEMVASQKEVAEHMMLVDLERHDLGYASVPSSVAWDRWRVEAFPNIQHMVSKVTGRLRPSSDVWSALEAVFPGGSITGCPKTATIAAIDALERQPRRGWTGSLGFADLLTGDGQWNILIRTLEAEAEDHSWHAVVKAGGGLTIGSDPAAEVREAKLKAARILQLAFSGGNATAAPQKRLVSQEPSSSRSPSCQAEVAQQIAVQDVASADAPASGGRLEGLLKAFEAQRQGGGAQPGSWSLWEKPRPSFSTSRAPRVVFVDNLDSFSLNVANALTKLGAEVLMVQGRGPTSPTVQEVLSVGPSHVVLGPGPGRPELSPLTMALAKLALAGRLPPVLGLCLGHQALGLAEGWRLSPSPLGPCHGITEEIWHHQRGIFSQLESPARMMRYNSLVLEPPASSQLKVCAWDASRQLPMALERPDVQVYGVQFHPESAGSYQGDQLLGSFLALQRSAL